MAQNEIHILVLQIIVILAVARGMGLLVRWVHQPQVVGEMLAGILLGPSALGLIAGGKWMHALFPAQAVGEPYPVLNILSQLGVMIFMFLIGLELDPQQIRGQGKAVLTTGLVSILAPFAIGLGMAFFLYTRFAGTVKSETAFVLFIGTALAITAFPVLARMLNERNLQKSRVGVVALTCAALNDVLGWVILAVVLAVVRMKGVAQGSPHGAMGHLNPILQAGMTVVFAAIYVLLMIFFARGFLSRLQKHYEMRGYLSQNVLALIFLLILASAWITDRIGIHAIFGAFMLGAILPAEGRFVKHITEKIEDFTVLFLLPIFFAYTGLHTDLRVLHDPAVWKVCGIVILTATAAKMVPSFIAARWAGLGWRQSGLIGVLMNTRGLMELVILNIGLQLGILSQRMFAIMVLMALVTTFMTTPLMRLLYSSERQKKELDTESEDKASGVHVLVPVSLRASAPSLVRLGAMLIGGEPGRIYALHLDRPDEREQRSKSVLAEADAVLDVAQETAKGVHASISAVSFISRNVARDIADAARRYQASWVVMGWHKPVFLQNILGGTVGQVLKQAPANVAILVEKGFGDVKRIVVPYLGQEQDRGALLAAERLGRLPDVKVTILHVVKPGRNQDDTHLGLQTIVDREMPASGESQQVRVHVVESDRPIDAVVDESHRHDLMVLGIAEEWGLEATLLGKQESIAQLAQCSLLIVHASPLAPVVVSSHPAPAAVAAEA